MWDLYTFIFLQSTYWLYVIYFVRNLLGLLVIMVFLRLVYSSLYKDIERNRYEYRHRILSSFDRRDKVTSSETFDGKCKVDDTFSRTSSSFFGSLLTSFGTLNLVSRPSFTSSVNSFGGDHCHRTPTIFHYRLNLKVWVPFVSFWLTSFYLLPYFSLLPSFFPSLSPFVSV